MAHRLSVADDAGYNIQRHVAANNGQGGGAAGQDVDVHRDPQAAMDVGRSTVDSGVNVYFSKRHPDALLPQCYV